MSHESFEQFRQVVLNDAALQEKFLAVPESVEFRTLVIRLGAERGYDFTVDDIEDLLKVNRRAWVERHLEG